MNIYIIIMYRWGRENSHTYPIGFSYNKLEASLAGFLEKYNRGTKYEASILHKTTAGNFNKLIQYSNEEEKNQYYEYCNSKEKLDQLLDKLKEYKYVKVHDLEEVQWSLEQIKEINYYCKYLNADLQALVRDISEPYIRNNKL